MTDVTFYLRGGQVFTTTVETYKISAPGAILDTFSIWPADLDKFPMLQYLRHDDVSAIVVHEHKEKDGSKGV